MGLAWIDEWVCEDCGTRGKDSGTPERCPACGSSNTTSDVGSVETATRWEKRRCAFCGAESAMLTLERLEENGWVVRQGKDQCPVCSFAEDTELEGTT
jgi:rubrerythrin